MEINRVFNWGTGQIKTDLTSPAAAPKKKGFFSQIKDAFSLSPSMPEIPDIRENIAKTFSDIAKGTSTESRKIGFETAELIARYSTDIEDNNLFNACSYVSSGSIGGPIGLSIPGFTLSPILNKIKINNPVIAEKVMINSIILMENSDNEQAQQLFPKAVEEFVKRAASDGTSPERAGAAAKVLNIINTPGISDDDKKAISKDALKIVKGQVDPLWVWSRGINHYKNGSAPSIEFAKFLMENVENTLQPIAKQLNQASSGKTGEQQEKALLNTAKNMASAETPENKALIAFQTLRMISSASSPNSDKAREILDMMVDSHNSTVASAYADMILGGKSPNLDPDVPTLISTGKAMRGLLSTSASDDEDMVRWFDSYLKYMEKKSDNPVEKQMINTGININKKLSANSQFQLAKTFFDLLSDGKASGPALIAGIGVSSVSGLPAKYSQEQLNVINTAKVFIEEISTQGGATGAFAGQVSKALETMPNSAGANFSKYSLTEIQKGISSPDRTLAGIANKAISPLSAEYSSDRKPKGEATKAALGVIADSPGDANIGRIAKIALESIDATPSENGYKNGLGALNLIETDKTTNPTGDMAGIFYNTMSKFAQEYSSDRSVKAEGTMNLLKTLRDNEVDPALKARLERTIDTMDIVEEKLPDQDGNLTVVPSSYRGFGIGLDVMNNISSGLNPDPAVEIAGSGLKMVKPMASEYSSDRNVKALICDRLYKAIEKYADKPEQKQAAIAYRELLENLGNGAVQSVGQGGLVNISSGKPFSVSDLAATGLQYFKGLTDQYSAERKVKSEASFAILDSLEKNVITDREKNILGAGKKVIDAMQSTSYGFRVLTPVLESLSTENKEGLGLIFSRSGKSFIATNFSNTEREGRTMKTTSAGAFLSQIAVIAEKQTQRGIAQMISLYCTKYDKENGYKVADAAFDTIAAMETLPDSSQTMEQMIDLIKENSPADIRDGLTEFMKSSLGSIYMMQDTLDNMGEAGKEIKREEEFVIIGGVKVKKRKGAQKTEE